MIKLEDRASVVILSLITFMGIFYAIMFLNDTFAAAFAERAGQGAPDEVALHVHSLIRTLKTLIHHSSFRSFVRARFLSR